MGLIARIRRAPAGPRPAGRGAGRRVAASVSGWLCLAAAPAFALMALLAGLPGPGAPDLLCGHGGAGGMVPMYLLMSVVHLPPWLRLAAHRKIGGWPAAIAPDR